MTCTFFWRDSGYRCGFSVFGCNFNGLFGFSFSRSSRLVIVDILDYISFSHVSRSCDTVIHGLVWLLFFLILAWRASTLYSLDLVEVGSPLVQWSIFINKERKKRSLNNFFLFFFSKISSLSMTWYVNLSIAILNHKFISYNLDI